MKSSVLLKKLTEKGVYRLLHRCVKFSGTQTIENTDQNQYNLYVKHETKNEFSKCFNAVVKVTIKLQCKKSGEKPPLLLY